MVDYLHDIIHMSSNYIQKKEKKAGCKQSKNRSYNSKHSHSIIASIFGFKFMLIDFDAFGTFNDDYYVNDYGHPLSINLIYPTSILLFLRQSDTKFIPLDADNEKQRQFLEGTKVYESKSRYYNVIDFDSNNYSGLADNIYNYLNIDCINNKLVASGWYECNNDCNKMRSITKLLGFKNIKSISYLLNQSVIQYLPIQVPEITTCY